MKFFKENSSMIMRLLITHIGMAVFGLVIFGVTNLQGNTVMLVASILSAVFYAVIVYTTMWEYGAKDKPAIDSGRLQNVKMCGFFVSLAAEAIFILIAVAYWICSYIASANGAATTCYVLLVILDSCFTGIMLFVKNTFTTDLFVAPIYIFGSLIISMVSALGYMLGTKEFRIIPQKKTQKE